jgi:hypothetical protein
MSTDIAPNADDQFFGQGMEYHTAGRFAAVAGFPKLTGNLFHHAVEMFIKAHLSKTVSLDDLKDKYGHKLTKLWGAFTAQFPREDLSIFNEFIQGLDRFEKIRYPDLILEKGASITVGWGPRDTFGASTDSFLTSFKLSVSEMDALVNRLFVVCSVNPHWYTMGLSTEARRALEMFNASCKTWFPTNTSDEPTS